MFYSCSITQLRMHRTEAALDDHRLWHLQKCTRQLRLTSQATPVLPHLSRGFRTVRMVCLLLLCLHQNRILNCRATLWQELGNGSVHVHALNN